MKKFIRENLMIVVSITLPLLVVIFFALASVVPGLYSTPPEFDLLLSLQGRSSAQISEVKFNLIVKEEQLKAVVTGSEQSNYDNNPRLFRYHHLTGEVTEISISIPENAVGLKKGDKIIIPELAGLKVSTSLKAPDGYEFRGRRSGGGMVTELFGGSRNRTDVSIAKNGAIVRVRLPVSDYWYNNIRFVGWLAE